MHSAKMASTIQRYIHGSGSIPIATDQSQGFDHFEDNHAQKTAPARGARVWKNVHRHVLLLFHSLSRSLHVYVRLLS